MKQGSYVPGITEIQNAARAAGIKPDWRKMRSKIINDPELLAAMQEMASWQSREPKIIESVLSSGKRLSVAVASSDWGGGSSTGPFINLESAITAAHSGDKFWSAIDDARKQAKRFQHHLGAA